MVLNAVEVRMVTSKDDDCGQNSDMGPLATAAAASDELEFDWKVIDFNG